jgi:hypothetical protein
LTCNALEWQVSEGGGLIIEADGTISVNNPDAIRSWQRAAHWIGWISPRSVTSLEEWDAINDFYHAGTSAFFRGWARSYLLSIRDIPSIQDQIGMTNISAGKSAQAGTLGGFGLGNSRASRHTPEALQLIQFLLHQEFKLEEARSGHESRNGQESYDPTAILRTPKFRREREGAGERCGRSILYGCRREIRRSFASIYSGGALCFAGPTQGARGCGIARTGIGAGYRFQGAPSRNRVSNRKSSETVSGVPPAAGSTGSSPHPDFNR